MGTFIEHQHYQRLQFGFQHSNIRLAPNNTISLVLPHLEGNGRDMGEKRRERTTGLPKEESKRKSQARRVQETIHSGSALSGTFISKTPSSFTFKLRISVKPSLSKSSPSKRKLDPFIQPQRWKTRGTRKGKGVTSVTSDNVTLRRAWSTDSAPCCTTRKIEGRWLALSQRPCAHGIRHPKALHPQSNFTQKTFRPLNQTEATTLRFS